MTKLEIAARQAFDALKSLGWYVPSGNDYDAIQEAITALRKALAEPQITTPDVCGEVCARAKLCYGCSKDLEEANAKYVEKAERVTEGNGSEVSLETEAQEPVACWLYRVGDETFGIALEENLIPEGAWKVQPLYAAPVRAEREWVDLTDDEIDELIRKWCSPDMGLLDFAWAAIAAFKEKNT